MQTYFKQLHEALSVFTETSPQSDYLSSKMFNEFVHLGPELLSRNSLKSCSEITSVFVLNFWDFILVTLSIKIPVGSLVCDEHYVILTIPVCFKINGWWS